MLNSNAKKRLVKLAQKYLDGKPKHFNCGSYNMFFKLTESFGIKTRRCDQDRDDECIEAIENYERAVMAHQFGCGPYTFGLFYHPKYGLCYLVELVEICKERNMYFGAYDVRERSFKEAKDVLHLVRKMSFKIKFDFTDCHRANVGISKQGQFICIDFDVVKHQKEYTIKFDR
jgi:hypothetical protein